MYNLKAADWQPKHFKWQVTDRVATVTLNRPERKNPLTFESYAELRDTFQRLNYADDVRAVVFTGEGGNFCSGGDVHEIIGPLVKMEMPDLMRFTRMTGDLVKHMRTCPQPIIAAVDGVAVGAGMNLALGCDVVTATERARFSEIFVRRGLTMDFGGSWLLPRIVGMQRAKDLALSGRIVDAEEALRIGLVTEVVPADVLEQRVTEISDGFLAGAPVAQMFVKQTLNASFQIGLADALSWEGEAQSVALGTEDAVEGLQAFLDKRDPEWKGR